MLVWTHERLGQRTHAETLGTAREGNSNHPGLYGWWRFWVHRIGCSKADAFVKVLTERGASYGPVRRHVYALMCAATSYFVTEVRCPGVSLAGIALSASSARR